MLKIKDNIDLKELENFGFKYDHYCCDKEGNDCLLYSFLSISPCNRTISISSGVDEVNGDDEIEKLFDLIQAGLVEKVEVQLVEKELDAMRELDEIIEYITEDKKVKYKSTILFDCEIIKDALLKAQAQEKLFKHIRRNDMEHLIPLSSIIGGLSQDDKHKFIEHIYYTWAELNEKYEKLKEEYKQTLLKAQENNKKAEALRELILNHIEFIVEKDKCYFKIKGTKGKEKSFTSYTMIDFWKDVLEND